MPETAECLSAGHAIEKFRIAMEELGLSGLSYLLVKNLSKDIIGQQLTQAEMELDDGMVKSILSNSVEFRVLAGSHFPCWPSQLKQKNPDPEKGQPISAYGLTLKRAKGSCRTVDLEFEYKDHKGNPKSLFAIVSVPDLVM